LANGLGAARINSRNDYQSGRARSCKYEVNIDIFLQYYVQKLHNKIVELEKQT